MNPGRLLTFAFIVLIASSFSTDARSFSAHDIKTLASAGVPVEYIQQVQELGYKDISAHDITTLYHVGVVPNYIKDIKNLGYKDISAHDITTLYAVGVKPDYIKQIKKLDYGHHNFSAHDLTILYSAGVTSEYVKDLKKSGQNNLSAHDIITLYSTGVTPEYIQRLKVSGQHGIHVPEIHIPEIHIPEINILVPNIQVQVKTNAGNASQYQYENETSDKWFWKTFAKYAVIALFLACLLLPIGFYFWKKRDQISVSDPLDTRITHFEKRVNDLQDILLSIDDRLDRKIRQS